MIYSERECEFTDLITDSRNSRKLWISAFSTIVVIFHKVLHFCVEIFKFRM